MAQASCCWREADGMDSPLLAARAPFDLIIANILAGPLIELAPDFAEALAAGGTWCSRACSTRKRMPLQLLLKRKVWTVQRPRRAANGRCSSAGVPTRYLLARISRLFSG